MWRGDSVTARAATRPLRSEADYDVALREIEPHFEKEPRRGTSEADSFLALALEDREQRHWPIETGGIEAIRYLQHRVAKDDERARDRIPDAS